MPGQMADLSTDKKQMREERKVSAHPSAQFRGGARQGRAGLGLRNITRKT